MVHGDDVGHFKGSLQYTNGPLENWNVVLMLCKRYPDFLWLLSGHHYFLMCQSWLNEGQEYWISSKMRILCPVELFIGIWRSFSRPVLLNSILGAIWWIVCSFSNIGKKWYVTYILSTSQNKSITRVAEVIPFFLL